MDAFDIISRYLERAEKYNGEIRALCPFHDEDTPSFFLSLATGEWYCHGCHQGGRFPFFARSVMRMSAIDAHLFWRKHFTGEEAPKKKTLCVITDLPSYSGEPDYLLSRGFTYHTIGKWGLGVNYERKSAIIPVRGKGGELVGWCERRLWGSVKYVFSKGLPVSSIVFGGDKLLRTATSCFLTEGAFDCIFLDQIGYPAISSLSSRLSPTQAVIIAGLVTEVYILFDNDEAGERGGVRAKKELENVGVCATIITLPRNFKDVQEMTGEDIKLFMGEVIV